jgi:ABC-type transport system substrate-binding protein
MVRNNWLPAAIFVAMLCARSAKADESPLFEQEPFDTIRLDDDNKNVVLKIQLLDLPNRQVPAKPNPDDELEIHLLDHPRKAYKLAWEHIAEVKLFERMVLDEAEQLTGSGKFDEAYPYYEFLQRRYPKMAELPASYEKYLLANAGAAYKQQRFEESLAVLWGLFDRSPDYKGVTAAIQRVVGKLFDQWVGEENYVAARAILRETSARLKDRAEPMVGDSNQRLQKLAGDWLAKAKQEFQAGRYADARHTCQLALAAWPEIEGGAALAAAMRAKYPLVEVGVTATAESGNDWAIHRTTRLLTRSLAELTHLDGERTYDTPLLKGSSLNGQRLSLAIKPGIHWPGGSALTAADLARTLLAEATPRDPSYRPQWAKMVAGVTLPAVDRVEVQLKEPIQRAEPWLDVPTWRNYGSIAGHSLAGNGGLGPYQIASSTPQQIRYLAVDDYFAADKNQPKEIYERFYPSTSDALAALRNGAVQIVDHVGPFDAASLKDSAALAVEPYAAATMHLLVFNRRRPMMNDATFRRAVAHALDRQGILSDNLSHGATIPGRRLADTVLSPRPSDASTPSRLRYDPSTAIVLIQVALSESQTQSLGGGASRTQASTTSLILEHPAHDIARQACLAMQRQLHAVGLTVTLRERSSLPAAPNAESSDADLYYVEWRPLEPASGLDRLLGADGLGGGGSEVADWISRLTAAKNSTEQADDELISEQTLLIPLWQLTDYVAYRRELHGIGQQPITLYQNVEQWRLGSDGE